MKILHVIETLGLGGAERLLTTLLPALELQGHDVCVAVLRPPLDLRGELEEAGVPVVQLSQTHKWNLLRTARNIARLAEERECGIIHAHLYFPAVSTALCKLLGMTKAATVVTFHNLAYANGVNKPGPGLAIRKRLASMLYPRGFDAMLGISRAVASHYASELGLGKVRVLHNPVDLDAIDRMHLRLRNSSGSPVHIVLPGRIVHEKGHLDLVAALEMLHRDGAGFRVTLAGDGPLRKTVDKAINSAGIEEYVTVTGELEHAEMLETIADADIVVIPSRFEGFGLTAIEAMALSRPVVATHVGGLTDIIRHRETGLLVPERDPRGLADALLTLMKDRQLAAGLGRAGREQVERHFALQVITDQIIEVYNGIAPTH